MRIVSKVSEMLAIQKDLERPLGLVPTMGALHRGHESLINQSLKDNHSTVVSIFVNPSQFNATEDLEKYPKPLSTDLALLEKAGVDIAFLPDNEDMYPESFETWIEVEKTSVILEGQSRPGHFKGVATIVTKLFNIVKPDKAYFGQKDAQQLNIIKRLNEDLNLYVSIIDMPTIRDENGLAVSSRNAFLSDQERDAAHILFQSLSKARDMIVAGQSDTRTIRNGIMKMLGHSDLISVDYISLSKLNSLKELTIIEKPVLISLAVTIGNTRLIDNIIVE
jgi:pantoate--beta-alanine ligase